MNDRRRRIASLARKLHRSAIAAIAFTLSGVCCGVMGQEPEFGIIPQPLSLSVTQGSFQIDGRTAIFADPEASASAAHLARRLRRATGFELPIRELGADTDPGGIVLRLSASAPPGSGVERERYRPSVGVAREGYRLSVGGEGVYISAPGPAGLFYGIQTLLQMLPPAVFSPQPPLFGPEERTLAGVEIADRPRFPWRGLMIDVSRHFFPKEQIIKTIDAMAVHKLNVLHLHLTDDTGWRIEIERYPRLTSVGAVGDRTNPGGPGKLFFSKDDIREIVAHARENHIVVVPEIDMPGHAGAAARAYPEFFDGHKTFNPAKGETYEFVENVLTEVMELFPSGYIHFGGDEVREHRWAELPEMAPFMREHGYADLREVEGHFDRHVADFIAERGFTPIGWDEVTEFGVHRETIVQWWLHLRPHIRDLAVEKGHRIIISPTNYLYFDYPNGPGEPGAPWEGNDNGPNSFELIHQWEPVPDRYTEEQESLVLGLQANLWTEFIRTNDYYEYMLFPRLSALAEVAWSPKGAKSLEDFTARLRIQTRRYEAMGLNYREFGEWPSDFSYLTH